MVGVFGGWFCLFLASQSWFWFGERAWERQTCSSGCFRGFCFFKGVVSCLRTVVMVFVVSVVDLVGGGVWWTFARRFSSCFLRFTFLLRCPFFAVSQRASKETNKSGLVR